MAQLAFSAAMINTMTTTIWGRKELFQLAASSPLLSEAGAGLRAGTEGEECGGLLPAGLPLSPYPPRPLCPGGRVARTNWALPHQCLNDAAQACLLAGTFSQLRVPLPK